MVGYLYPKHYYFRLLTGVENAAVLTPAVAAARPLVDDFGRASPALVFVVSLNPFKLSVLEVRRQMIESAGLKMHLFELSVSEWQEEFNHDLFAASALQTGHSCHNRPPTGGPKQV